jgi:hypothetical protein
MIFFGVVSAQTRPPSNFLERQQAEAFIAELEEDEPEPAALLRVEGIEL